MASSATMVINKRMDITRVEDILTKMRRSNPSKKDETALLVSFLTWITVDIRRIQFSHLIDQYFLADNIDHSVLIQTLRRNPVLLENELIYTFYISTLEKGLPKNDIPQGPSFQEKVKAEAEKIQKEAFQRTDRTLRPLPEYYLEFPCHPMCSTYNTNTPQFDPSKLFSFLKPY